jgi:hypothetical protein
MKDFLPPIHILKKSSAYNEQRNIIDMNFILANTENINAFIHCIFIFEIKEY